MEQTKPWWQSKTVWGTIVAGVSTLLQIFGIDVSDFVAVLTDGVLNIVTFVGVLFALWGRVTAKKVITASAE